MRNPTEGFIRVVTPCPFAAAVNLVSLERGRGVGEGWEKIKDNLRRWCKNGSNVEREREREGEGRAHKWNSGL